MEKTGLELIAEERQRQIEVEGWTPEHDAEHNQGELANAAALYAMTDEQREYMNYSWGNDMYLTMWAFELSALKFTPEDRIRQLQKAGALIAAEMDRLILEINNMTEEVVNKVAELYKLKAKLYNELSNFKNNEFTFEIGHSRKGMFSIYGATRYTTITSEFLQEIKSKTEEHIKQQISEIDKQLEEL